MKNLIFLILSVTIMSSCSIEKRLYNKGYSVQWHKSKASNFAKSEPNTISKMDNDNIDLAQLKTPEEFEYSNIPLVEGHAELLDLEVLPFKNNGDSVRQIVKEKQMQVSATPSPKFILKDVDDSDPKPKKEGLALASLILGILALPILSIVFGLIQLKRIKNDPLMYGGDKMAVAGVILGVLYILIASALLAFMYGTFFIPILLIVSVVLSVVGIIQLIQRGNGKEDKFGILFTIAGWLGLMFTTLLVFP